MSESVYWQIKLIDLVFEQIAESWDEWREGLGDRLANKSQHWYSEHSPVFSQDKLIRRLYKSIY